MIKRAIVLLVVAAALAAGGAGWKWQHSGSKGNYRIAGWTWGDDAARWSGDET